MSALGLFLVVAELVQSGTGSRTSELLVLVFGTQANACDRRDFDMGGSGMLMRTAPSHPPESPHTIDPSMLSMP